MHFISSVRTQQYISNQIRYNVQKGLSDLLLHLMDYHTLHVFAMTERSDKRKQSLEFLRVELVAFETILA